MSIKSAGKEERESFEFDYQLHAMTFRPDWAEIIHYQEMKYESLKNSMPERFDLKNLDNIFSSWFKELNNDVTNLPPLNSTSTGKFGVVYQHDNHKYLSDHYISTYMMKGVTNKEFRTKLANNGFIYSKPFASDGINIFKDAQSRHRSTTFVKLDVSHIDSLKKLKEFAANYLGTNKLSVKLFYDFYYHRFDFKAYNRDDQSKGVVITFEDLPVKDDIFDDDYWLEVDVDDKEVTQQDA